MVEPTISEHRRRARAVLRRPHGIRSAIAFAALLICVASFGENAQTEIAGKPGEAATVKMNTLGCPSMDGLREVELAGRTENIDRAVELAIRDKCVSFEKGETVTIMRVGPLSRCVKPLGNPACFWIRFYHLNLYD
jgi:hypothetical protein